MGMTSGSQKPFLAVREQVALRGFFGTDLCTLLGLLLRGPLAMPRFPLASGLSSSGWVTSNFTSDFRKKFESLVLLA